MESSVKNETGGARGMEKSRGGRSGGQLPGMEVGGGVHVACLGELLPGSTDSDGRGVDGRKKAKSMAGGWRAG